MARPYICRRMSNEHLRQGPHPQLQCEHGDRHRLGAVHAGRAGLSGAERRALERYFKENVRVELF
jgi:hypothetical protein